MARILKFFCLVVITLFSISSCKQSGGQSKSQKDKSERYIMTVGKKQVPTEEFQYTYEKNNNDEENIYTSASLEEYIKLYEVFQLKVLEAESQKLDTNKSFINEFAGYKKQLAKPYLTESSFTEKLAKEAYNRMKEEVRTSHILIKVDRSADPADTLAAFERISQLRKKVLSGTDFGETAKQYSEDESAKMEDVPRGYKGDLGFFSALSLVYEYENAMYNTPVGEISDVFRTQFGYHILKVTDRKTSQGEVTVAHIMIAAAEGISKEDSLKAKAKIDDAFLQLQKGNEWNDVCRVFSEHDATKERGGRMQPFTLGGNPSIPASFEATAFELDSIGQISKPIKTPYGWHILRLIDQTKGKSFEETKEQLINKIKRKPRAQLDSKVLTQRLKKENDFKANTSNIEAALASPDSSIMEKGWKYDPSDSRLDQTLFTLQGNPIKTKAFFDYVGDKKSFRPRTKSPQAFINLKYDKFVAKTVYDYEEANLEKKYPDYRMLVKEYRDGILLFDLMNQEVWNKAVKDTLGLKAFYEENKSNYQWKERLKGNIYTLSDPKYLDLLNQKLDSNYTNEDLISSFKKVSPLAIKVTEGQFEKDANDIIKKAEWKTGKQVVRNDEKTHLLNISEILPPGQKQLSEARGLIISGYQEKLERDWIKKLRDKYQITVNQAEVERLIKN